MPVLTTRESARILRANRDAALADLAALARDTLDHRLIGADDGSVADVLIAHLEAICRNIGIPQRLGAIGVEARHLPELVRGARGNSMSGNPRQIDDEELHAILERML